MFQKQHFINSTSEGYNFIINRTENIVKSEGVMAAENYPVSEFFNTKTILTSLGTGEALISAKGASATFIRSVM